MAGHSKWANIKHRKARQDARRSKIWSKCARAIIMAAKQGGANPDLNLTLRYAIDEAKAENMPKDTIEKAIAKGSGEGGTENYEAVVYEGYGPAGVAVMIEILTDNRNRTAPEIRKIFEKHGGNLGATGCVAYSFHTRGQLFIAKSPSVSEERVMELALDAGADDVNDEGEGFEVLCDPAAFNAVRKAFDQATIPVASANPLAMIPTTTVAVTGHAAERTLSLIETLEDHDDVQKVYANFETPDEQLV